MGALVAATLVTTPVFVFAIVATGHWREWHHAYLSVPPLVLAFTGVAPLWVGWVGYALLAEDALQHLVQIVDPDFLGILHLAYRHLLYNPWHRWRAGR